MVLLTLSWIIGTLKTFLLSHCSLAFLWDKELELRKSKFMISSSSERKKWGQNVSLWRPRMLLYNKESQLRI
jgi:hypothetical protein